MDDERKKIEKGDLGSALTRREWLLGVGPAVVLPGLSGTPAAEEELQPEHLALPPGLYTPSFDHLSHALANESPFVAAPVGSKTEYVRPRVDPFEPRGFAAGEFPVARRLVEIILGEDLKTSENKPERGAPACIYDEVAEWIDLVVASAPKTRGLARNLPAEYRALAVAYGGGEGPVSELENFEPERICREGLAWLEEESQRRFTKGFLHAGAAEQVALVQVISDARPDKSTVHAGTRLFDFLKAECIRGFYTSAAGLKELDYQGNAFYGEPPGCGLTKEP